MNVSLGTGMSLFPTGWGGGRTRGTVGMAVLAAARG
jgi:hypothetical protein